MDPTQAKPPSSVDLLLSAHQAMAESWTYTEEEWAEFEAAWLGGADRKIERLTILHRVCGEREKMIKAEIDLLNTQLRAAARTAAWAEGMVRGLLEARRELGEAPSVKGPWGFARLQRNSAPSLTIEDPSKIPLAYQRVTVEPDRAKLTADIKAGGSVAGCTLVYGEHVRLG